MYVCIFVCVCVCVCVSKTLCLCSGVIRFIIFLFDHVYVLITSVLQESMFSAPADPLATPDVSPWGCVRVLGPGTTPFPM